MSAPSLETDTTFICDAEGCHSQPFKRRGDLTRHSRIHGSQQRYDCSAQGCDRHGTRGFTRKDKLVDHMLAGHDDDILFTCPLCKESLTRDLTSVHHEDRLEGSTYQQKRLDSYRTSPVPRCSYKLSVGSYWYRTTSTRSLARMQAHLLAKHDLKARTHFTNLLGRRGYHAESGGILCPVCPGNPHFPSEQGFGAHFMQIHFIGPACSVHADGKCFENHSTDPCSHLLRCTFIPDEVREHRRTILRMLPEFRHYPVWGDIKCRGP